MYKNLLSIWKYLSFTKAIQLRLLRIVNDEFLIGVTGVIFNKDHEVLLVKHTYRKVPWSLPGGYLKGKEHPKQGLQREIREETGLAVQIEKIIHTNHDEDSPRINMTYIGTYTGGDFIKSDEVIDYGFYSLKSLPPLIEDQTLQIELGLERYNAIHTLPFHKRLKAFFKHT